MRTTTFKISTVLFLFCSFSLPAQAQVAPINIVENPIPLLRISPDARSGGMGELGVATSPDAYSGLWNMGKPVFHTSNNGIAFTYTPWFKKDLDEVYMFSLSGFHKIDSSQAICGSLRYFSLGTIQFTDNLGNDLQTFRPREFAIDAGYSRKLTSTIGLGVSLKYITSNLANGTVNGTSYKTGSTIAGDIGLFNQGMKGWNWGVTLNNLGAKIGYTDNKEEKDFTPANLGLGANYTKKYDDVNKLSFGVEIHKLLVPEPPRKGDSLALVEYRKKGVVGSWFDSFGDSGGFKDELREFQVSAGAEYTYNNQFSFRAGYFFEDKTKGNRKYFTLGAGVKYNMFGTNFSYLLPSGSGTNRNPLSNTMRFSLVFDFDK